MATLLDECQERLDQAQQAASKTRRFIDVVGTVATIGGVVWIVSILARRRKPTKQTAEGEKP